MSLLPMHVALQHATAAANRGEIPVGAVIVDGTGQPIAAAGNAVYQNKDPTAHAEILAIRQACRHQNSERLLGCSLYVTLEPCAMCAAAIAAARIARLYYGASDAKSGGIEQGARIFNHQQVHHKPDIYSGICSRQSETLLTEFFKNLRRKTQNSKTHKSIT